MEQNIIGLGFDINSFSAEQQKIVKGLLEVYDLGVKISGTEIKPGSTGGFTELKQQTDQFSKLSAEQDKVIVRQQKIAQEILKTQKIEADAAKSKANQLSAEEVQQQKILKTEKLRREGQLSSKQTTRRSSVCRTTPRINTPSPSGRS